MLIITQLKNPKKKKKIQAWDFPNGSVVSTPHSLWGRMDTWTCVTESLCCSPEAITALLIGSTLKQNNIKESRFLGEIITTGMQMTPPLWQKVKRN